MPVQRHHPMRDLTSPMLVQRTDAGFQVYSLLYHHSVIYPYVYLLRILARTTAHSLPSAECIPTRTHTRVYGLLPAPAFLTVPPFHTFKYFLVLPIYHTCAPHGALRNRLNSDLGDWAAPLPCPPSDVGVGKISFHASCILTTVETAGRYTVSSRDKGWRRL